MKLSRNRSCMSTFAKRTFNLLNVKISRREKTIYLSSLCISTLIVQVGMRTFVNKNIKILRLLYTYAVQRLASLINIQKIKSGFESFSIKYLHQFHPFYLCLFIMFLAYWLNNHINVGPNILHFTPCKHDEQLCT